MSGEKKARMPQSMFLGSDGDWQIAKPSCCGERSVSQPFFVFAYYFIKY
jgi:hypothetical protein